jgi:hypothetical protein
MVALEASVIANGSHFIGQTIVVGEKRPSLPVATQRLGWEKTRAANRRHPATGPSALSRSKTLRPILDDRQIVRRRNGIDPIIIGHLAE